MKIIQVNKFFFPSAGAERVFFDTTELLRSHGHEVAPFSIRDERNLPSEYSEFFPAPLDLTEAGKFGFKTRIATARRFWFYHEAYLKIRAVAEKFRPDAAHLHNIYHHLSPSVAAGLKSKSVPVVMTLHDFKLVCPAYSLFRAGHPCQLCSGGRFYKAVVNRCVRGSTAGSLVCAIEGYLHKIRKMYLKNVDVFVSPSLFLRDKFEEMGFPPDRIRVLPNFTFPPADIPDRIPGDYSLYMGRLHETKGVDVLIRALEQVQDPSMRLVIAGAGPEVEKLRQMAGHRLGNRIQFAGFVVGERLEDLIRGARFGVVPSVWYENCPMVVLEFWRRGLPVVASDLGGLKEMIDHGGDGLLFTAGDPNAMAEAMTELWSKPELTRSLGREGFEKLWRRFGPEAHYQGLMEIYEEAKSLASRP